MYNLGYQKRDTYTKSAIDIAENLCSSGLSHIENNERGTLLKIFTNVFKYFCLACDHERALFMAALDFMNLLRPSAYFGKRVGNKPLCVASLQGRNEGQSSTRNNVTW